MANLPSSFFLVRWGSSNPRSTIFSCHKRILEIIQYQWVKNISNQTLARLWIFLFLLWSSVSFATSSEDLQLSLINLHLYRIGEFWDVLEPIFRPLVYNSSMLCMTQYHISKLFFEEHIFLLPGKMSNLGDLDHKVHLKSKSHSPMTSIKAEHLKLEALTKLKSAPELAIATTSKDSRKLFYVIMLFDWQYGIVDRKSRINGGSFVIHK